MYQAKTIPEAVRQFEIAALPHISAIVTALGVPFENHQGLARVQEHRRSLLQQQTPAIAFTSIIRRTWYQPGVSAVRLSLSANGRPSC